MMRITAALLVPVVGLALAACEVKKTEDGKAPDVDVEAGKLPEYDVDLPKVGLDTQQVVVPEIRTGPDSTTRPDTTPGR